MGGRAATFWRPTWHRLWRGLLLGWLCWAGGWVTLAQAEEATLLVLRNAVLQGAVEVDGGGVQPLVRQDVQLPYHWDRRHRNRAGEAVFELHFTLPPGEVQDVQAAQSDPDAHTRAGHSASAYSLFFPLIGNAAEVWLNDKLLTELGDLKARNQDDFSKVGRHLRVPPSLLQADNQLRIKIRADGGRRGGLSEVYFGRMELVVAQKAASASTWRLGGSLFLGAFSLVVGLIAMTCWFTQLVPGPDGVLRRDSLYLSAGLAELCWALRVFDALIERPPLSWPWWGVVMTLAYAGWIGGVMLFSLRAAGLATHASAPYVRGGAWTLIALAGVMSALSFYRFEPLWLTAWLALAGVCGLLGVVTFSVATWRNPSTARWVLTAAGLLNVAVGVRDWVVIRLSENLGAFTWSRYVTIAFGLALLFVVMQRFKQASGQARELLQSMRTQVAEREQELASTYARLEAVAREQARTAERERILRDMHDGVGSHLSAAIRQLQAGRADERELLRTLRDSMDQLKLSIDAMQFPAGDVDAMLAALRYRLEPRLTGAGITLVWAVEELRPRPFLDAAGLRKLQFLLFEAISNVLQHAQAQTLQIAARMVGEEVEIRVSDDGCGFDASRVPRALQARAMSLDGRLQVRSGPGGTEVSIVI